MIYRLIIAGSRTFDDYSRLQFFVNKFILHEAQRLLSTYGDKEMQLEFISGNCPPNKISGKRGADYLGELYAKELGYTPKLFPADWDKYGAAAGPFRNMEMAKYASEVEHKGCLVFWDGKSKGSFSMISAAKKFNITTEIVRF